MEREISLEEVTGNCLSKLDELNPEDKGFDAAVRANDMLLKHTEESDKMENDMDIANRKLELEAKKLDFEKEKLEFEKVKLAADDMARERDAKIQDSTNRVALFSAATVFGLGLAKLGFDIWGLNKVGKFEQTGVWRSTASKIFTNKIGKK